MKTLFILLAALLFVACNSSPAAEDKKAASAPDPATTQLDPHFRAFMSKFKVIQLPLTIRPMELGDVSNLPLLYGGI